MKLYFVYSAAYEEALIEENVPILLSYAYRNAKHPYPVLPKFAPEIFIDSGAFTIQKSGYVSLDAYGFWLNQVLGKYPITLYANLDVIGTNEGSGEATLRNQKYLEEKWGLRPLPTWHAGEPDYYLDYYCDNYEYVAIGALVTGTTSVTAQKRMWLWINDRHPNTKFHLFGVGVKGARVLTVKRAESSDFSTWLVPAMFGHTVIRDKRQMIREVEMSKEDKLRMRVRSNAIAEMKSIIRIMKWYQDEVENCKEDPQGVLL